MNDKTQVEYLYNESVFFDRRDGDIEYRDKITVTVEEMKSPRQTRLLTTVSIYFKWWEEADPDDVKEILHSRYTPNYLAIRDAILRFDKAVWRLEAEAN